MPANKRNRIDEVKITTFSQTQNIVVNPSISIIMPCYNHAPYVGEAIKSALTQTLGDFELLIHEDKSNDNSLKIIQEYEKKDSRIKVLASPKNIGITNSYNRLVSKARGKYIAVMESDDISFPNRLEVQYRFMESHPDVDILTSRFLHWSGDSLQKKKVVFSPEEIRAGLLFSCIIANPTLFFKRDYMGKIGFTYDNNLYCSGDYGFFVKALLHQTYPASFYMLPNHLVKYRRHASSTSLLVRKSEEETKKIINDLKIIYGHILNQLGINMTEDKFYKYLHLSHSFFLSLPDSLSVRDRLLQSKAWLETIISTNRKTLGIDEKTLRRMGMIYMYHNTDVSKPVVLSILFKDFILHPDFFLSTTKILLRRGSSKIIDYFRLFKVFFSRNKTK